MITGDAGATKKVLTFHRQTMVLEAGYLVVVALALNALALSQLHILLVSLMMALLVPLTVGGCIVVRNENAAALLAKQPGGPAKNSAAWGALTFFFALLAICGLAAVLEQVRDDVVLRTPAAAVIDNCQHQPKGHPCSGHWTIDGRTYDGDQLADDVPIGSTVTVLYTPTDPSYVRVAGDWASGPSALGACVLVGGLAALVPNARREQRARRAYLADVRALLDHPA